MQPVVRAAADPAQWEVFTCLKAGTRFAGKVSALDRSAEGRLVYG